MHRPLRWFERISLPALVAVGMALMACGGGADGEDSDATCGETVDGQIRQVEAKSLLELNSLVVEDSEGKTWVFDAGGAVLREFTPSHLREHMVQGLSVRVSYRDDAGTLVICDVAD